MSSTPEVIAALAEARRAEKEQALFYRALAAQAEDANDAALAEDLNGLLADEQHHLSRLTVRLLELDQQVENLDQLRAGTLELEGWRDAATAREAAEIARYEHLLQLPLDPETAALISGFLEIERKHASTLGGKYMEA